MPQKEIIMGALALLVLGGGVMLMTGKSAEVPAVSEADSQTAAATEAAAAAEAGVGLFTGSFADLAKRGGSYECSFSAGETATKSEGVVYVSGNKIRGNFATTEEGKVVHSSMIQDGENMYVWTEAMPQGMKMKIPAAGELPAPKSQDTFHPDLAMTYDCKAWVDDASWFVAPPNVEFMSL